MAGRILRRAGDLPSRSLWNRIKDVALTDVTVVARAGDIRGTLEQLEEVLLAADFGVPTTMKLVADIEAQARRGTIKTEEQFLRALESAQPMQDHEIIAEKADPERGPVERKSGGNRQSRGRDQRAPIRCLRFDHAGGFLHAT